MSDGNIDNDPACQECNYFEAGEIDPNDVTDRKYFCKRLPPVPVVLPGAVNAAGQMSVNISTVFPMTMPSSWCGEWDDGSGDDDEPQDNNDGKNQRNEK